MSKALLQGWHIGQEQNHKILESESSQSQDNVLPAVPFSNESARDQGAESWALQGLKQLYKVGCLEDDFYKTITLVAVANKELMYQIQIVAPPTKEWHKM